MVVEGEYDEEDYNLEENNDESEDQEEPEEQF